MKAFDLYLGERSFTYIKPFIETIKEKASKLHYVLLDCEFASFDPDISSLSASSKKKLTIIDFQKLMMVLGNSKNGTRYHGGAIIGFDPSQFDLTAFSIDKNDIDSSIASYIKQISSPAFALIAKNGLETTFISNDDSYAESFIDLYPLSVRRKIKDGVLMPRRWKPFEDRSTIGKKGFDEGIIYFDEEYKGIRVTLEKKNEYYTITCSGGFLHKTRAGINKAFRIYTKIKEEWGDIMDDNPGDEAFYSSVSDFILRY